jgi:magnesium-dependent phosphatase 1
MTIPATSATRDPHLPKMVVFDLDDCLWSPEMHELYGKPNLPVQGILNPHVVQPQHMLQGVIGLANSHGQTVTLFEGARRVLYELATDPKYHGIVLAVASSSLEPAYSRACLQAIEILPGKTMQDIIQYHQIGRTGKLTPRKTAHFRELHRDSGIAYEDMLFFDGR